MPGRGPAAPEGASLQCMPCRGDGTSGQHQIHVALDDMKFCAAHFIAFKGFREPLHGHNYSVVVRAGGTVQADGYVADFGDLKRVARLACKSLDHATLVPARSDVIQFSRNNGQVEMMCEGGARFSLPEQDCVFLQVKHTSAEELAEFLWREILVTHKLGAVLAAREAVWLEVTVSERPGQGASYRAEVSRSLTAEGRQRASAVPVPRPCFGTEEGFSGAFGSDKEPADGQRQRLAVLPRRSDSGYSVAGPINSEADAFPVEAAEAAYKLLLDTLGPDSVCAEVLQRTPHRAAKAFGEMTRGMRIESPLSVIGNGIFDVPEARDLVAIRDMPFHSMCEHHLLPFSGIAHIAYIPDGKVLGLSKFPRLLEVFARRLQLQERLTSQYADACIAALRPRALAVALEATHACMCHRGVGVAASTRTLVLRGPGKDEPFVGEQLMGSVAFAGLGRARL